MGSCVSKSKAQKAVKTLTSANQYTLNKEDSKQDNALKDLKNQPTEIILEIENLDPNLKNQDNAKINPEKFNGPAERPKTANKAFGGISDFLLFLENRNPKMKEFAKEFKNIEDMRDSEFFITRLNKAISPKIEDCLNETYWKLKAQTKSIMFRTNKYSGLFTGIFKTWGEFYKQIFHAYTINGFLYLYMNEYLRNENWMELDFLLPYTYCLFKAFLWGPTGLTVQKNFETLKSKAKGKMLTLYRGVDFDDESLKFYDLQKIKYFSWNGVISTSLDKQKVERFQVSEKPTLIIIEINFEDLQPENLNALYLAECSAHSEEQEVALPPGSIFELLKINKEDPEVIMRLRLLTNAKDLAYQGQFLHGMLQSTMRNEKELKIVCLTEKDLSRAIKHCKGNLLIEDLEFSLCDFNQKAIEILQEVLPTTKNLKSFTLNAVTLEENCNLEKTIECLGMLKIKKLEILISLDRDYQFKSLIKSMPHLGSLRKMKLTLGQTFQFGGELVEEIYNTSVQCLHPQCLLEFKIQDGFCFFAKQLGNNYFHKYFQEGESQILNKKGVGLKSAENLMDPDEYFANKPIVDIKPLNVIEKGIGKFLRLTDLVKMFQILQTDNTSFSQKQTEELLSNSRDLCEKIQFFTLRIKDLENLSSLKLIRDHFKELTTLNLYFTRCLKKADKPLPFLEIIGDIESLTTLNLHFDACDQIVDQDLKFLQRLKDLKSLTTLHLNFAGCIQLTDQTLLSLEVIQQLKLLTNLHLIFDACNQISEKSFELFQGIECFESLKTLYLSFAGCTQLTDEILTFLQKIKKLKSFTTLHLNFAGCFQITDKVFTFLDEINEFESLTFLFLNFDACKQITEQDFKIFSAKVLERRSLNPRFLDFASNKLVAEKKDNSLEKEKRMSCREFFSKLSSDYSPNQYQFEGGSFHFDLLELFLSQRARQYHSRIDTPIDISVFLSQDNSALSVQVHCMINNLARFPVFIWPFVDMGYLECLKSLHFRSNNSNEITDSHLETLGVWLMQLRGPLTDLHINFNRNSRITVQGFQNLLNGGILNLRFLESLHLNFNGCFKARGSRLKFADWGKIRDLKNLNKLYLSFNECNQITDSDLYDLCYGGIRHLKSLKNLFLYIPSASISEEFENEIFNFDSLTTCVIILRNQASKRQITEFNLKRSNRKPELDQKEIESSEKFTNKQSLKNIVCSKRPTFEFEKKLYSLNKEALNVYKQDPKIRRRGFLKKLKELLLRRNSKIKKISLHLTFLKCENIISILLESIFLTGIELRNSLVVLDLSFYDCLDITEQQLSSLASQVIQHLKSLQSLQLNFSGCLSITDQSLKSLCSEGFQQLHSLLTLKLIFAQCPRITSKGLEALGQGIQNLKSLQVLDLNFDRNDNFLDEGLVFLSSKGIRKVQSLTILNLSFIGCSKITDEGLESLFYKGIRHLKLLKKLSLHFDNCRAITDGKFENLYFQIILQFPSLKSSQPTTKSCDFSLLQKIFLVEDFHNSHDINLKCVDRIGFHLFETPSKVEYSLTDLLNSEPGKTLKEPNSSQIQSQEKLNGFSLKLEDAEKITDNDLQTIYFERWIMLSKLQTCHLIFDDCKKITGEGLGFKDFCSGFQCFESLTALSLSFNWWTGMNDNGIRTLCLEGIQHLKSLVDLDLSFDGLNQITDDGFQFLCQKGIWPLSLLKSLSLNVKIQGGLSDQGLLCLCCETIQKLDSLTSLKFIFKNGDKVTDKGLKNLISKGMPRLLKLEIVQLSFPQTLKISPNIYQAFLQILRYFGFASSSNFN